MENKIRIAIIDLECTCNDSPPFGMEEYEVIEIGAVACEMSADGLSIIDELQFYVKPIVKPVLTPFCIQLTGIGQEIVDQAKALSEVLPKLYDWMLKNDLTAWGSWGNDRSQFIIETRVKDLNNPIKDIQHFDIKKIFSQNFGWRVGMTRALSLRGLQGEGRLHSGIDDAKNVAKLLAHEETLRSSILSGVKSGRSPCGKSVPD